MSRQPKAIYEPGELDRVRQKLGPLDAKEAKQMAELLGGEVGIERSPIEERPQTRAPIYKKTVDVIMPANRRGTANSGRSFARPRSSYKSARQGAPQLQLDPADDPAIPIKQSWRERARLDRYAAQPAFEIKSSTQALASTFAIFAPPLDLLNPDFCTKRLGEYYKTIETLVVSTRSLLPRNNPVRGDKLQRLSPFVYQVIDSIRSWPLEIYSNSLARIQANPREVLVADSLDILKSVYRPLYILERLDSQKHIVQAYRLLYKLIALENPEEAKRRFQPLVRSAIAAYEYTHEHIHYLLHPLLMKVISDRLLNYKELFIKRRNRFLSLINADPSKQIQIPDNILPEIKNVDQTGKKKKLAETEEPQEFSLGNMPASVKKGLEALDLFFPKSGMNRLYQFPELYPYFKSVFSMPKGFELIAPEDPMQQVIVLIHVLEEFFYGLRYIEFSTIPDSDGEPMHIDKKIEGIINNWHSFIERLLVKEYYQRLNEYCRILDNSAESRSSRYAVSTIGEVHWIKRLYFLPYYDFNSTMSPTSFRGKDLPKLQDSISELKNILSHVAAGIDAGIKAGGPAKAASCAGIDNPWDRYVFQVPNPISIRLDALLPEKNNVRRTNAALVYFTLQVVRVLDYIVNDRGSWAYLDREYYPFRSVDGHGNKALYGAEGEEDIDSLYLFEQSIAQSASEPPKSDSDTPS